MPFLVHKTWSESRALVVIAGVLTIALWAVSLWLVPRERLVVPLHYTIYFGIDLSSRWQSWLWLPGLGTVIMLTHFVIGTLKDDTTWQRVWLTMAVLLNILLGLVIAALAYVVRSGL
ncbi:MAG: hypothetical protein HY975_00425 [Candidatus Kerfeldbacteria bacterium]|nr:hypothetical protein [Candidatus Kerfeldbacteria bacterium]